MNCFADAFKGATSVLTYAEKEGRALKGNKFVLNKKREIGFKFKTNSVSHIEKLQIQESYIWEIKLKYKAKLHSAY